ncbi:MAG: glycerol-3-phosphate 1-O-acyltransferase PlsY [Rubellimicrobium sp.]|nr:glycerol-3-phosphate 1-O-acyltransferase PlsY [Rubellimicrobium sp.]
MPDITTTTALLLLWAAFGYFLGSIPFGLVLARILGLGDLRKIGSGNIGATNVLRTGNRGAALGTLLLDGGKGAVAVLAARALAGEDAAQVAGGMAFIGHCFPVWLGFRGGKGVATFFGLILALAWPVGLAACATWAVTAAALRYSSVAALLAAGFTPVWAVALGRGEVVFLALALAVIVYIRHAGNIARLHAGTEPRIGRR